MKRVSAPYLLWMVVFVVIPILMVMYFAFTTDAGGFTLANMAGAMEQSHTLLRSLGLAALATAICLIIGYPMAMIIARAGFTVQQTMVLLCMMPMWMNFLLRTYGWMTLIENNGLINQLLMKLGMNPLQMINTSGAVVLGMVYNFLPFMIVPVYTVMARTDSRLLEAAQDLGCNAFSVLRRVTLPLSLPGVVSGVTMVFVPAVSTFIISKLLNGGEMLYGDIIEQRLVGDGRNLNLGAAMSLVLMLIVLVTMGIMNRFGDKDSEVVLG